MIFFRDSNGIVGLSAEDLQGSASVAEICATEIYHLDEMLRNLPSE